MKTHFLFPRQFKIIGWILLGLGIAFLFLMDQPFAENLTLKVFAIADNPAFGESSYFSVIENEIFDELTIAFLILGGLFVGFSRCKNEDEFIGKIRYESLVWAVYFNFGLLLAATLTIFGTFYMSVVAHNIFSLLIFFIIRFHLKLYQLQKSFRDDE